MREPQAQSFTFVPIEPEHAREIATWHYDPPHDFYDMVADREDLAELLDPARRRNYYAALSQEGELVGFFCFGPEARVPGGNYEDDALDIGLGLKPDLTGKELGGGFLLAGLEFARERFSPLSFRLSVATFNERAGFRRGEVFIQSDGDYEFLITGREA